MLEKLGFTPSLSLALYSLEKLLWPHFWEIHLESDELPGAACSRVLDPSPRAPSGDKNLQNQKFWRSAAVFQSLYRKAYMLFSWKIFILTQ